MSERLRNTNEKLWISGRPWSGAWRSGPRNWLALNVRLEASNARLQELDRLKSDFVSDVSHELRTPLTSIYGFVDYLLAGH